MTDKKESDNVHIGKDVRIGNGVCINGVEVNPEKKPDEKNPNSKTRIDDKK